jgi:phage terminase Nu1 subunit (DNA packaging protein)
LTYYIINLVRDVFNTIYFTIDKIPLAMRFMLKKLVNRKVEIGDVRLIAEFFVACYFSIGFRNPRFFGL